MMNDNNLPFFVQHQFGSIVRGVTCLAASFIHSRGREQYATYDIKTKQT